MVLVTVDFVPKESQVFFDVLHHEPSSTLEGLLSVLDGNGGGRQFTIFIK